MRNIFLSLHFLFCTSMPHLNIIVTSGNKTTKQFVSHRRHYDLKNLLLALCIAIIILLSLQCSPGAPFDSCSLWQKVESSEGRREMTYKYIAHVKTLRHLLSELRQASSTGRLTESPLIEFVFLQYKKFRTTTLQICRAQEEMSCLTNGYVTYLQSSRQYKELLKTYQSAKERSVEEAASMVGYKLPQDSDPYLKP